MKNVFIIISNNKARNWSLLVQRGARTKSRLPASSKEKKPAPPPELIPKSVQEIISQHKSSSSTVEERDDKNAVPYSVHPDDSLSYTKYRFVDTIQIEVQAGRGGNGCISYERLSPARKRPSGGNGGRGGHVFVIAKDKFGMNGLNFSTIHFNAEDGSHGGSAKLTGRNGADLYISVPVGTIVSERIPDEGMNYDEVVDEEEENDEEENDEDTKDLDLNQWPMNTQEDLDRMVQELRKRRGSFKERTTIKPPKKQPSSSRRRSGNSRSVTLDKLGQVLLVAEGGNGGIGNNCMAGTGASKQMSLPRAKFPGSSGEAKSLTLELQTLADVGLVGYPNAGKSSLLRALSNATPRVGYYPFTTLHPTVGIVEYSDYERVSVADIPGLIEGAHENRGLGHDFLKHIEKTKMLLYVVDISGEDERAPANDLRNLLYEIKMFDPLLLQRPAFVFANKIDIPTTKRHYAHKLQKVVDQFNLKMLTGSTRTGAGLAELAAALRTVVHSIQH